MQVLIQSATTSTVDTEKETTFPELEAPATTAEGLQALEETTVVVVKDSYSNIDEMTMELSQIGGSEVPTTEVGGASASIGGVVTKSSQPKESHKRLPSPTHQPGDI